ncbi:putative UDP-sugar transporter protein SLC35A4 [Mytilus galloprovincialis]|uniref:putative UDP-sugar transporter protein SLC35A4 n=1 Tax=Mytilus galloprovincialis TaxID=29158 RepID=UPI003F7BD95C
MKLYYKNDEVLPLQNTKPKSAFLGLMQWTCMLIAGTLAYGSYTIFVHLCEVDGRIPFSSASSTLMIETSKLVTSLVLYLQQTSCKPISIPKFTLWLPFSIPAILYAINNNMAIHMQLHMDPTSYQVLSNMKIGVTAVLYRIIIGRRLSKIQWFALGILTIAGLFDSYGGYSSQSRSVTEIHITLTGLIMMISYCSISGFAGVYSEYILKRHIKMSLHLQNMLLYIFGVCVNGIIWFIHELSNPEIEDRFSLFRGYTGLTVVIILSQALNGLIMSSIMKYASNITRLFIISCSTLITAVLSVLVFGTTLNMYFVMSAVLVCVAIYIFYMK